MKQRVKLAISVLNDAPLVLLDEPGTNLDKTGVEWFQKLLVNYSGKKIIFISSNRVQDEAGLCNKELNIEFYKP